MPTRVFNKLPAIDILHNENICIFNKLHNNFQKIRPIKLIILNLMPKKIETENQFLRLLSNSPLQIDVQFVCINRQGSKNTPSEHLNNFYYKFIDIKNKRFDGLLVTGAPLGLIQFQDVAFWPQIKEIIKWAIKNITSTLFVCWSVQAVLNVIYNIPKYIRKNKLTGVYTHNTFDKYSLLTRGFDDTFLAPHSRYSDFPLNIILYHTDLKIFAGSEETGAYLFASKDKRIVCVTGHPEYDATTLSNEYQHEIKIGLNPLLPCNYFPKNDPKLTPKATWRSHGYLLFANWLNYYVYPQNSHNLNKIKVPIIIIFDMYYTFPYF